MRANWKLAAGGAALLAAGLSAHLRTRSALRAHPPLGGFVEAHGLRLHYMEKGQGPALVLLHGLGSMVEDFVSSGLLERLAASYRVIAFDRPGYGHSDAAPRRLAWPSRQAQVLREALHKLNVRHPIVLGHSWGSLVALAFALRYPGAVRSIALVSGYFFPTLRLDAPLLSPPGIPLVGDLLRFSVSPWFGRFLWPVFLGVIFAPARAPRRGPVPKWLALRPAQLKAVGAESLLTVPAAWALSRRYRELTLPMCIVAGAQDRYVSPRSHSVRLKGMLRQSRLMLVPGAGHMVHHTHPGAIVSALEALQMPAIAP
jgi:pimeloyl-ACP methyl ester carboxylesterase